MTLVEEFSSQHQALEKTDSFTTEPVLSKSLKPNFNLNILPKEKIFTDPTYNVKLNSLLNLHIPLGINVLETVPLVYSTHRPLTAFSIWHSKFDLTCIDLCHILTSVKTNDLIVE